MQNFKFDLNIRNLKLRDTDKVSIFFFVLYPFLLVTYL